MPTRIMSADYNPKRLAIQAILPRPERWEPPAPIPGDLFSFRFVGALTH